MHNITVTLTLAQADSDNLEAALRAIAERLRYGAGFENGAPDTAKIEGADADILVPFTIHITEGNPTMQTMPYVLEQWVELSERWRAVERFATLAEGEARLAEIVHDPYAFRCSYRLIEVKQTALRASRKA